MSGPYEPGSGASAEKEFFQPVLPSGHAADDAAIAAQGVKLQLKGY